MKRFRHGFILGKFYPPHNGHHHLIDAAAEACERVTVMILAHPQESIDKMDRLHWLLQRHINQSVSVLAVDCDLDVDYTSEKAWREHIDLIYSHLNYHTLVPVDAVFTSENYGDELARRMKAAHVRVDLDRATHPVSGTAVRADTPGNWRHLAAPTRRGLCARVVVLGAESTGTTTLSQALAAEYGCPWVPEYGRMFSEGVGKEHEWTSKDLVHIAAQQSKAEEHMAALSPILICDTDALATSVWHEFLVGGQDSRISRRITPKMLYLLTSPHDIAWEDDGTRIGESFRDEMDARFLSLLLDRDPPFACIYGTREERLEDAKKVIDIFLEEHWSFTDPVTEPTVLPDR